MSPLLLLIASTILLGVYVLWTIGYFFVKRKILNTGFIIKYFTIVYLVFIVLGGIMEITDPIYWIYIMSILFASAIIYFLNKGLNEENFQ